MASTKNMKKIVMDDVVVNKIKENKKMPVKSKTEKNVVNTLKSNTMKVRTITVRKTPDIQAKEYVCQIMSSYIKDFNSYLMLKNCELIRSKSIRTYIMNAEGQEIGCLVAFRFKGQIHMGYSSLNGLDLPLCKTLSRRVAGLIAEMNAFSHNVVVNKSSNSIGYIPMRLHGELIHFLARCCRYFKVDDMTVRSKTKNGDGYKPINITFAME